MAPKKSQGKKTTTDKIVEQLTTDINKTGLDIKRLEKELDVKNGGATTPVKNNSATSNNSKLSKTWLKNFITECLDDILVDRINTTVKRVMVENHLIKPDRTTREGLLMEKLLEAKALERSIMAELNGGRVPQADLGDNESLQEMFVAAQKKVEEDKRKRNIADRQIKELESKTDLSDSERVILEALKATPLESNAPMPYGYPQQQQMPYQQQNMPYAPTTGQIASDAYGQARQQYNAWGNGQQQPMSTDQQMDYYANQQGGGQAVPMVDPMLMAQQRLQQADPNLLAVGLDGYQPQQDLARRAEAANNYVPLPGM